MGLILYLNSLTSMVKKIIKIAIILIVILVILGGWFWFRNIHSREVLRLDILGPSEAEAGSEVNYIVRFKNNGNIRLEDPVLAFEFPKNTIIPEGWMPVADDRITIRGERRVEIILDDIQPGEERTKNFRGLVFGVENSSITANARIEYRPRNLNARFEADTSHTLLISEVPLTFEVHLPSRTEPGKEFSFEINYFSRIEHPLSDLRVKIEYPSGFEFLGSRPKPSFEQNEWDLGVLNRGQGGRIEVKGTLTGEPSQSAIFQATLGFWQDGKFVRLKESVRGIELATPLIFISHLVNGSPDYIPKIGEYLFYEISFKNTGDSPLEDLFLTVKLDRNIIDFDKVQPGLGNFQENVGMIFWDSASVSQLRFLPSMEEGRINFWVRVMDDIKKAEPAINIEVSLSHITERISNKIKSQVLVSQKVCPGVHPFENYGPTPPVIGTSTSYTINWKAINHNNNLEDAIIRATLPRGVRLSGEVYPKDSTILYDTNSREVIWDIGDIVSGAGIIEEAPEVYFQVIFSPERTEEEQALLISSIRFTAMDQWTESLISTEFGELLISLVEKLE